MGFQIFLYLKNLFLFVFKLNILITNLYILNVFLSKIINYKLRMYISYLKNTEFLFIIIKL